jgi:hypothetical protein
MSSVAEQLLQTSGTTSVATVFATSELLERYPPRDYPAIIWLGFDDLAQLRGIVRGVLDVVVSELGRNERDATTVVQPNLVIGSEV